MTYSTLGPLVKKLMSNSWHKKSLVCLAHLPLTAKKRLTTFTVTKVQKQKVKLVKKERRINQRYLKRQLAWISRQGTEGLDFTDLLGPISPLPQALIGSDGLPYKSTKSNTTEFLRKRYSSLPVITDTLPPPWTPHTAILEGMFLIQSSPLPSMSCMKEYTQWLLHQYIRPHFRAGVQEVHVVFDTPGSMPETPKELEKRRRDKEVTGKVDAHECNEIQRSGELWGDTYLMAECTSLSGGNVAIFVGLPHLHLTTAWGRGGFPQWLLQT